MSKDSSTKRPQNAAQYNSSSMPTVLIVVAISTVMAIVALMGTTA